MAQWSKSGRPTARATTRCSLATASSTTETHWKHICFEYDDFYLGHGCPSRFRWTRTQYVLHPGILETLERISVPVEFALEHMMILRWSSAFFSK
jgi:hypothetical protein